MTSPSERLFARPPRLIAASLLAMSAILCAEVRNSVRFSIAAETVDGGGGSSQSSRYSHVGSVEPTIAGVSELGTTTALHGFISALTVEKISAYDGWALAHGLTIGVDAGFFDDPNQDGVPNIRHFAFDSHPLAAKAGEEKRFLGLLEIGGSDYLTLTVPVRNGALFSGDPLASEVDGIVYEILGDTDLNDPWSLSVVEVVPAFHTGLPTLGDFDGVQGADWQYRTFRLTDPVGTTSRQFMKAGVSPSP